MSHQKIVINSTEEAIKIIEKYLASNDYKGGRSLLYMPLPQAAIKYLHEHGVKLIFPYAERSLAEITNDNDYSEGL